MRNALLQHVGSTRSYATAFFDTSCIASLVDNPVCSLSAPLVEVIKVEVHVGILSVRRAYRIAGLAVFAKLASICVWLKTCILLCGSRRAAIRYFAATECEILVRAATCGSKDNGCGDCEVLAYGFCTGDIKMAYPLSLAPS
jgi:hypothetical protein